MNKYEGWRFYRFDYTRYVALRPALRSATTPQAFAAVADNPRTDAIVDALMEEEITLLEARHAFIEATCCLDEPLSLDHHLPRLLSVLARRRGAEDIADTLSELLAGQKNKESWLLPSHGLIGYLTPAQTEELHEHLVRLRQSRSRVPGKRRRHGGWLSGLHGFLRGLLSNAPEAEELLELLSTLTENALAHGDSIAVVAD